ncbi:MAG TPA: hypothetical protein VGB53_02700 [Rubricoccaceae bacterium]|jgi:hypothetical protein
MRPLCALALVALLAGCASAYSTVDPSIAATIPRAATVVRLHSALPADSLRSALSETFEKRRVRSNLLVLVDVTGQPRSYTAGPIDAGRGTFVFADIVVEPEAGGSAATLRGEWGMVRTGLVPLPARAAYGSTLERAAWVGGRPGAAFGALVTISKEADPAARLRFE